MEGAWHETEATLQHVADTVAEINRLQEQTNDLQERTNEAQERTARRQELTNWVQAATFAVLAVWAILLWLG